MERNEMKEIRSLTGLSQAKFAKCYEIPSRTVEAWETGERKCPAYVMKLLRRAVEADFPQVEKPL